MAATAFGALAFFASAPASATVLCGVQPARTMKGEEVVLGCPAFETLSEATLIGKNSGNIEFDSALGDVVCTSSSFEASLEGEGEVNGGTAPFTFGEAEGKGCSTTIFGCTSVKELKTTTPISTSVVYQSLTAPEGKVVLSKPETTIKLFCAFTTVTCVYGGSGGETYTGAFKNLEQRLEIDSAVNKTSGSSSCPASVTLHADYNLTALNEAAEQVPAQVAEQKTYTVLCKAEPVSNKCPAGNLYSGFVYTTQSATAKFKAYSGPTLQGEISCAEAGLAGEFETDGSPKPGVGVSSWLFTGKGGFACTTTLKGWPTVTVKVENLKYDLSYFVYWGHIPKEPTSGFLHVFKKSAEPQISLEFDILTICKYKVPKFAGTSGFVGMIKNGSGATPTSIEFTPKWKILSGQPAACPPEIWWQVNMYLIRFGNANVYLARE
ncbi:MAG TPA: hypothetical protein VN752_08015 [Solirubrobacterales bacterium]|nr:hypothetical protein [Solirubrobacterales bacterium]